MPTEITDPATALTNLEARVIRIIGADPGLVRDQRAISAHEQLSGLVRQHPAFAKQNRSRVLAATRSLLTLFPEKGHGIVTIHPPGFSPEHPDPLGPVGAVLDAIIEALPYGAARNSAAKSLLVARGEDPQ